jgi:drug/metabolite transporter (DMT)-like permease
MQANLMLLLAAAIWGLGFVAQRLGMDHLGPYSFNSLRFFIGALSLLPLICWYQYQGKLQQVDWKLLLGFVIYCRITAASWAFIHYSR